MKEVIIDEEKVNLLSTTIMQIVSKYSKRKNVEAICIRNYDDNNKPTICIDIIYNSINMSIENNEEKKFNQELEVTRKKTGITILFSKNVQSDYSTLMMHSYERRACKNLVNSQILFDRNDEFTNLKNYLLTYDFKDEQERQYSNAIEFKPPLQLIKK